MRQCLRSRNSKQLEFVAQIDRHLCRSRSPLDSRPWMLLINLYGIEEEKILSNHVWVPNPAIRLKPKQHIRFTAKIGAYRKDSGDRDYCLTNLTRIRIVAHKDLPLNYQRLLKNPPSDRNHFFHREFMRPKTNKPKHYWVQTSDREGNILASTIHFVTLDHAKTIAAQKVSRGIADNAIVLKGTADPENPNPDDILEDFTNDPDIKGYEPLPAFTVNLTAPV